MPRKPSILLSAASLALTLPVNATEIVLPSGTVVQAPAEPSAIPLYGEQNPGSQQSEVWSSYEGIGLAVRNVTYPTLTPVLPAKGKANGAAVIVMPGGGFMMLAMEHEGWKAANALAEKGITAFVLKYRVLPTPVDQAKAGEHMADVIKSASRTEGKMPAMQAPDATADGAASINLVRSRAAEWNIDPERIGVIGFSAGAMNSLNVVLDGPRDSQPRFVGYIYGPQGDVTVPADAPPMFDAISMNDMFFSPAGLYLANAWIRAGRKIEIHAYQDAPHGFGVGIPGTTTANVIGQFVAWLEMQGFLAPSSKN